MAVARAGVQQAEATLAEVAPQTARAESLFKRAMISPQDVESARAGRARAEAARASAIAQLAGAQAALDVQHTALRKATIRAPISGIVLERSIERGRTVTAAFQTPVLFVLAADLARMTLSLDVDEADIGQVANGPTAEFSVDAYPDRVFTARVRSVRNAAKTVEGVVTYQAILDVANPEVLLRPGMTATARIETAKVANALLVPNAALRFSPEAEGEGAGAPTSVPGEVAPAATGRSRRVWPRRRRYECGRLRHLQTRCSLCPDTGCSPMVCFSRLRGDVTSRPGWACDAVLTVASRVIPCVMLLLLTLIDRFSGS